MHTRGGKPQPSVLQHLASAAAPGPAGCAALASPLQQLLRVLLLQLLLLQGLLQRLLRVLVAQLAVPLLLRLAAVLLLQLALPRLAVLLHRAVLLLLLQHRGPPDCLKTRPAAL